MLVRTRKKVLEQIGEDHHVLLPSRMVYADFCICGERFARSPPGVRIDDRPRSEERENVTSPTNAFEIMEEQGLTPPQALMGNMEFDWQEWDASVGMSMGSMS